MARWIVVAYAACALIWGTTWYAIRVCIGPGGYESYTALALRFGIATLALLPIALRCRPWPRGRTQWTWLIVAGALDAAGYVLVYLGEERAPASIAAVVYGTSPLVLAIVLAITRVERMTRAHVVGAAISLAGVVVLALDRLAIAPAQAIGVGLVQGSVVISTIYSTIMKRHAPGVHAVVSTTIFLAVTALGIAPLALVAGDQPPWPPPVAPTTALLYLAIVGSVVAFLAYFWLLERTSLLVTSTLVFVYPLIALAIDLVFEPDLAIGWHTVVGTAIVLAGLLVSLRRRAGT